MGNSGNRRRIVFSSQTLPAFLFIILGGVMMLMPFIVKHSGYTGDAMVASENVTAPFDKTIILIGQESLNGSVGLILNKPLSESQHAKLSPFLRDSGIPVGYGGPLEVSERIFVLEETSVDPKTREPHIDIATWDEAVRATPDLLNIIRRSLKKGEQRYKIVTGFTAWGAFQLAEETLVKHRWHAFSATHDMIFQNGPAGQWDTINQQEKAKEHPVPNQI